MRTLRQVMLGVLFGLLLPSCAMAQTATITLPVFAQLETDTQLTNGWYGSGIPIRNIGQPLHELVATVRASGGDCVLGEVAFGLNVQTSPTAELMKLARITLRAETIPTGREKIYRVKGIGAYPVVRSYIASITATNTCYVTLYYLGSAGDGSPATVTTTPYTSGMRVTTAEQDTGITYDLIKPIAGAFNPGTEGSLSVEYFAIKTTSATAVVIGCTDGIGAFRTAKVLQFNAIPTGTWLTFPLGGDNKSYLNCSPGDSIGVSSSADDSYIVLGTMER